MSALPGRAEQAVCAADMARDFNAKLKEITSGDVTHLVIFKDNEPAAVLIGASAYQALRDELDDFRADHLALQRLSTLDEQNTSSLEDMEARLK